MNSYDYIDAVTNQVVATVKAFGRKAAIINHWRAIPYGLKFRVASHDPARAKSPDYSDLRPMQVFAYTV